MTHIPAYEINVEGLNDQVKSKFNLYIPQYHVHILLLENKTLKFEISLGKDRDFGKIIVKMQQLLSSLLPHRLSPGSRCVSGKMFRKGVILEAVP